MAKKLTRTNTTAVEQTFAFKAPAASSVMLVGDLPCRWRRASIAIVSLWMESGATTRSANSKYQIRLAVRTPSFGFRRHKPSLSARATRLCVVDATHPVAGLASINAYGFAGEYWNYANQRLIQRHESISN